ncbi:MAG: bacterial/archaeal transporter family-2 protein [Thermoleophilaceae bacterium]|nr:bacterial/archaeal transporter family-2 protein [Thermoleophilaceae bacterium]
MGRGLAIVLTLGAGALVAFQPPANALLARRVGDLGAAFTSLLFSTLLVGAIMVVAGQAGQLGGLRADLRPEYVLGGVAGVAVVLMSLVGVRWLGVGGVAAALVGTQLIFSAVIDRMGLLDVTQVGLTPARIVGIALLIAGTVLVTSR